jgi:CDP-glycerol glycerophosphotransferase (TagB/SpsB family)
MNYQYKFSIIIAVYNVEEYLEETINSILNQTLNFKENIQLILVDDGSTDNSNKIATEYKEKYPENIIVIRQENQGQSTARNNGLKYAKGKYVNFLDSDDYISQDTLKVVYDFFEKHQQEVDVVAIPMLLFERVEAPHRLNNKFQQTRVVNLIDEPNNPQLSSSSAFIKYDAIKDYEFDTKLVNLEDALIINKIFLEKKKYGLISNVYYYYRQRMDATSTVDTMTKKKEYYTSRLERFYYEIINYSLEKEGKVPKFIQALMAYDLQWVFKVEDLEILETQEEIDDFWEKIYYILSYIDEDVIMDNEYIDEHVLPFFIYLKHDKNKKIEVCSDDVIICSNDYILDKLSIHPLWFDIIELNEDIINFSGNFESLFENKYMYVNLIADCEGEKNIIPARYVKYNNPKRMTLKYITYDWKYSYNFDVSIKCPSYNTRLYFEIVYDDGQNQYSFNPHISFRNNCGLSTSSAYFTKDSKLLLFKNNSFHIQPEKYTSMIRYDISNIKRILYDKQEFYLNAILYKTLYLLLYPIYRNRKIWLYSDRPDFADDNAKHLYKYSIQQEDEIRKYFIINKDSKDYNNMKKTGGNIVSFGGLKHKLLYLFAQKVISSYVNENFINPFHYKTPELYSGMITSNRYFLQHGVTKDDVSEFIKKYDKNLSLIVTVSERERQSFLQEGYNFDEDIIQTLGFPRYDNLTSNDTKKQILYMPTWRIGLNYPKRLLESDYYKTLVGFLNNQKLKEILENSGYTLVFKPHPELKEFMDIIEIPEYVQISEDESYQKLFADSSLLITDYSSVFFDFAYLEKPVIYYQADDDYHYENGYFDYETDGFGEVIKEEEELIELINNYIKNECQMKEGYNQNMKKFFKYNDKNNCKRVYGWILDH